MADRPRHFLDISTLNTASLEGILDHSAKLKQARAGDPRGVTDTGRPLRGRILAMIFEKPSTRTRVSFDVAMRQLGGESLVLSADDLQLGRGETIADTARVLSRFVDCIMIRTFGHEKLLELAEHASVPVINGLTDFSHPCQVMADLMTMEEKLGGIAGKTVAWIGDGNNVTTSWIHAAARFGFSLRIAGPKGLHPPAEVLDWARREGGDVTVGEDAHAAAAGAHCVVTDVWLSIHEDRGNGKHDLLKPYQVNAELMAKAASDAVFMHCLPAHRGEEVTADVIDGRQSAVFDEAENRLHAQKGILTWCFGPER